MNLRDEIKQLAHRFDEEDNAAFDLWTWLPSHKDAVERFGDYASEHMPSTADVMREAAIYIGAGCDVSKVEPEVAEVWFKVEEHP